MGKDVVVHVAIYCQNMPKLNNYYVSSKVDSCMYCIRRLAFLVKGSTTYMQIDLFICSGRSHPILCGVCDSGGGGELRPVYPGHGLLPAGSWPLGLGGAGLLPLQPVPLLGHRRVPPDGQRHQVARCRRHLCCPAGHTRHQRIQARIPIPKKVSPRNRHVENVKISSRIR